MSYSTTPTLLGLPSTTLAGRATTPTATVAATDATPTGTVTFLDNSRSIGTATLAGDGQASLTFTPSGVGTHVLSVVYGGQGLFSSSIGAPLSMQVVPIPTATTFSVDPPARHRHGPLTLAATVSSADQAPSGVVVFSMDSRVIGTATLDAAGQAKLTRHFPRHGRFRLSVSFAGRGLFGSSNSPLFRVRIRPGHRVRVVPLSPSRTAIGSD